MFRNKVCHSPIYRLYTKENFIKPISNSPRRKQGDVIFYKDLKPIVIFCKLMGLCTIRNIFTNNVASLNYKLISCFTHYGGLYSLESLNLELEILSLMSMRRYLRNHPQVLDICFMFYILCPTYYFHFSRSNVYNVKKWDMIKNIQGIFLFLPRQIFLMCYVYFCYNIKLVIKALGLVWRHTVDDIMTQNNSHASISRGMLENIRIVHVEVLEAVMLLNSVYGTRLLYFITMSSVELVYTLYILSITNIEINVEYSVFNIVTLYILSSFTEDLIEQVSITFYSFLLMIQYLDGLVTNVYISAICNLQVEMFMKQITVKKLNVSAAGFFSINKKLLVSVSI
ncbi:hypothetical protein L9F63_025103, partial [Diploptera punctata]